MEKHPKKKGTQVYVATCTLLLDVIYELGLRSDMGIPSARLGLRVGDRGGVLYIWLRICSLHTLINNTETSVPFFYLIRISSKSQEFLSPEFDNYNM